MKNMAWNFQILKRDGAGREIIEELTEAISGITGHTATSAKMAISDARHDASRAFLFWNEDHAARSVPPLPSSGTWMIENYTGQVTLKLKTPVSVFGKG